MNSFVAAFLTLALALAWLRAMDFAAHRGWLESRLSRKLIHIGTGPIFVLCWLMFPGEWYDRILAALVPGMITVQFALIGLGVVRDEASVRAMSRSGDPREILRGPLFYGIMFVALTLLFWKDSPVGMTALLMMCGGDGVADLAGRRIRSPRLPWSPEKSVAGSLSVFIGGVTLCLLVLGIYVTLGVFAGPLGRYLMPLAAIGVVSVAVESLPHKDVDNITMTFAATLTGWLVL